MSILSLDHHSLKQSELKIFFAMSHLARSYVKFLQQAKSAGLVQARNMSAGHSAGEYMNMMYGFYKTLFRRLENVEELLPLCWNPSHRSRTCECFWNV